jgi:hypothetical protein
VGLFIPAQYLATGLEAATTRLSTPHELLEDAIALTIGLLAAFEVSRKLFRWEPEAKVPGRAKLWVLAALVPFLAFGTWECVAGTRLHRIDANFRFLSMIADRGAAEHSAGK